MGNPAAAPRTALAVLSTVLTAPIVCVSIKTALASALCPQPLARLLSAVLSASMQRSPVLMGKNGVNTYKSHVMKMLDKRLGARDPLECTKETADVLMCWSTIFTSATAQYDPTKCKRQEDTLFKCQLSMESGSTTKQRRAMKASIIHQVLTIANSSAHQGKFKPRK